MAPIQQVELLQSRELRFSTDRYFLTRVFKVYFADQTTTLEPWSAVSGVVDTDALPIVTGKTYALRPRFVAIDEADVEPATDRPNTYIVRWTYVDQDAANAVFVNTETQVEFIDTYRIDSTLASESDRLILPTTEATRSVPGREDISGIPIDEAGKATSHPLVTTRITESKLLVHQAFNEDDFHDYVGTRNSIVYRGKEIGTCLYLGPTTAQVGRDMIRVTHRVVYDPQFHLRQTAFKYSENGSVRPVERTVTMADASTRVYENAARTVYWIQPFPRETDWPVFI